MWQSKEGATGGAHKLEDWRVPHRRLLTFVWALDLPRTTCAEGLRLQLGGGRGCRQREAVRGRMRAGSVAEIDTIRVNGLDSCGY